MMVYCCSPINVLHSVVNGQSFGQISENTINRQAQISFKGERNKVTIQPCIAD